MYRWIWLVEEMSQTVHHAVEGRHLFWFTVRIVRDEYGKKYIKTYLCSNIGAKNEEVTICTGGRREWNGIDYNLPTFTVHDSIQNNPFARKALSGIYKRDYSLCANSETFGTIMASTSRKREATSVSAGGDAHFLSDVIRTAEIDNLNTEKMTKFIKAHLDNMSEDQLTRFKYSLSLPVFISHEKLMVPHLQPLVICLRSLNPHRKYSWTRCFWVLINVDAWMKSLVTGSIWVTSKEICRHNLSHPGSSRKDDSMND